MDLINLRRKSTGNWFSTLHASGTMVGSVSAVQLIQMSFALQMYTKLDFCWASTLLGLIAAGLAPIPIVLFFWGPQIRARSKFARRLIGVK
jgi:hypothetical protein